MNTDKTSENITWLSTYGDVVDFCNENPLVLMAYVAKEDPKSKLLLYRYAVAAAKLRQTHPLIRLGAVDLMVNPDAASNAKPISIPYLDLMAGEGDFIDHISGREFTGWGRKDESCCRDYRGLMNRTVEDYMASKYPVKKASTEKEFKEMIANARGPMILELNLESPEFVWSALDSKEFCHINVDRTINTVVGTKYGLEVGSEPTWVRVEAGKARAVTGPMDLVRLGEFVHNLDVSRVRVYKGKEDETKFPSATPDKSALYFYNDAQDLETMRPTLDALSMKHADLTFYTADANKYDRAYELGMEPSHVPFFAIEEKTKVYGIKKPSKAAVEKFVDDYHEGKLKPNFRSELLPWGITDPAKFVGYTLNPALEDTSKTFFIRFHCDRIDDEWKRLALHYKNKPMVVIGEYNIVKNSSDFPAGDYLFPAGAVDELGHRKSIRCRGYSSMRQFIDFIEKKGEDPWPWIRKLTRDNLDEFLANNRVVVAQHYHESPCLGYERFISKARDLRTTHPDIKFVEVADLDTNEVILYENGCDKNVNGSEVFDRAPTIAAPIAIADTHDQLMSVLERRNCWNSRNPLVVRVNSLELLFVPEIARDSWDKLLFAKVHPDLNHHLRNIYHTSIGDAPAWLVIHRELFGDVRVYTGEMERDQFENFLKVASRPLFGEVSFLQRPEGDDAKWHAIYYYRDMVDVYRLREPMEALAREYPQFTFAYSVRRNMPYLNLQDVLALYFVLGDGLHFLGPASEQRTPLASEIAACVAKYAAGTLELNEEPVRAEALSEQSLSKPTQKKSPQPLELQQSPNEPIELVELIHDRVIGDVSRNVFVWYYGDDDPLPPLSDLAEGFTAEHNVVLGYTNVDKNDIAIPGDFMGMAFELPMLALYPAHGEILREFLGLRKPLVYTGPPNPTSLGNFLATGSPVIELTADTYRNFVKTTPWAVIKHYRLSQVSEDEAIFYQYALEHSGLDSYQLLLAQIDVERELGIGNWRSLGTPARGSFKFGGAKESRKQYEDVRVVYNT